MYRLPKSPGQHEAELLDEFDADGTISSAGIDKTGGRLCLLGYNFDKNSREFTPFVWEMSDYVGADFFGGKQQRFDFQKNAQMEGICFKEKDKFLISHEANGPSQAMLYQLELANK